MALLSVFAGLVLAAGFSVAMVVSIRRQNDRARWTALARIAANFDAVGFDGAWTTRAYYVNGASMVLLGMIFTVMGAGALGWVPEWLWLPMAGGLTLMWFGLLVLSLVVARTGRPARLVPPPFRVVRGE